MVRMRKNVWSLPAGDKTLEWYAKAIDAMLKRPREDPSSWVYMAAVHGSPQAAPSGVDPKFWEQCQHQSWYFLPWHRAYVASFEAVVAKTIADLGGPSEWALPYWDYSEANAGARTPRLMPPAFIGAKLGDGSPNRLWSQRRQNLNGDFNLDDASVALDALKLSNFTGGSTGGSPGFGGPATGFSHFGGVNGSLERLPHNRIHGLIGGLMNDPDTAALDPIFWLHHCNIDRLWEVWRNQGGAFRNPKIAQWLSGLAFDLHDGAGRPISLKAQDLLDTSKILHGYCYDSTPLAHEPTAMLDREDATADESPELVAATDSGMTLEDAVSRATLSLALDQTGFSFTDSAKPTPAHVYLNLENVTGSGFPTDVRVLIEPPGDPDNPVFAGFLTTFGLARASNAELSTGSGVTEVLEITDLADQIGLSDGSATELNLRFEKEESPGLEEDAPPEEIADLVAGERPDPTVAIGRVSLYFS